MTKDNNPSLLSQVLRSEKRTFALMAAMAAGAMVLSLLIPALQKVFLDALTAGNRKVWIYLALTLLAMGLSAMLGRWSSYYAGRFGIRIFAELKNQLLARLLELPRDFFAHHQSGYLTARLELDTANAGYFYSPARIQKYFLTMTMGTGLVILFRQSCLIGAMVSICVAIYFFLLRRKLQKSHDLYHQANELQAIGYGQLHQIFSNIVTVKSQAGEGKAQTAIRQRYDQSAQIYQKILDFECWSFGALRLLPPVVRLLILLYGVMMIEQKIWSLGELWAILAYAGLVFTPATSLADNLLQREQAQAAANRVQELYNRLPEPNLNTGIIADRPLESLRLEMVSFGYHENETVINELSFELKRGEILAVTGPSGSGKTTLMSLLLLLYRPTGGVIKLNGIESQNYNLRSLRQRIGYVCQTPQFFPGTLRENLGDGDQEAALRQAGAADLIARLDEIIEENAENFSVGERLRIAVAREFLRNTDLIILDEPTANLDAATEKILLDALASAMSNKMAIIVTHRDAPLAYADRVIDLDRREHSCRHSAS